ncbi:hypothetical protein [Bacillus gaemokensis]|uniref:Uncharacterized protein n=1 Tax=Bacillus gaemokensis TaxID=574375 RepID=A0A073K7H1_9BACI|nr:hypothetical protein [Bacillus gaemokensis]KEK22461.1 hypothetical protein BAGA_18815 [Bacillus gaemokensis]KYG28844.1 hypothetical protein AZF08_14060 [Bacillus gaemokensis]
MQTIEIYAKSGAKRLVQMESYDADLLNGQINNKDLVTVLIGDLIYSRLDIKCVLPQKENGVGARKIEVRTSDGKIFEITTDDYDPVYINEQLNSSNTITVVIGDYIFSRLDIKQIVPVKVEPTEPTPPPVEENPDGSGTTETSTEVAS